ncbi:HetP family heterocyst commitment protein [Laspinema sp. A4]|nr:HetP family heterocyst commitment protein [Laspinema sp. D2d]
MTQEQFDRVVEAILAGQYSWACVLILRFGGYNPLHYIPYRTYNRLMKQQRQGLTESGHRTPENNGTNAYSLDPHEQEDSPLKERTYLEVVENPMNDVETSPHHSPLKASRQTPSLNRR